MTSVFCSYVFFLLSLLVTSPSSHIHGAALANHHDVNVSSLLPQDVCSPSTDFHHSTVKVVDRYGPCSPIKYQRIPTTMQILNQDQIHIRQLHRKVFAASNHSETPTESISPEQTIINRGDSFGSNNYIVTIGLGTPIQQQTVLIDTGSSLTWVQCKPCYGSCYPQNQPLFDPFQSPVHKNVSCPSPACSALENSRCTSTGACIYMVNYVDKSYTKGLYVQDTFTLTSSDVVQNFQFGCGHDNSGSFGKSAGLLGLGRGPSSIVSQTSNKYGRVFSYCLPPLSNTVGYLTLGSRPSSSNIQFTPLLASDDSPSLYRVELLAISVDGRQLSIPSMVFQNTKTYIDSGAIITRLPPSVYIELRTAFSGLMLKYKKAIPYGILDTCYVFNNGLSTAMIPRVALQFRGATIDLSSEGTMYNVGRMTFCLGFATYEHNENTAIIGNAQQRSLNMIYDLPRNMIGFGPGGC